MKNLIFTVAFLMLATFSFGQSKSTDEVSFKTSAICGMCKSRIERDLGLTKGVESATLDLETKVVSVTYKSKKTNAKEIQDAITKIGYDANEMIADQKAHDRLPACCQKSAAPHKD